MEPVIPEGVAEELDVGPEEDPARRWLQAEGQCCIRVAPAIGSTIAAWDLGVGESQVLAWPGSAGSQATTRYLAESKSG